mgnify:FL=1
MQNSEIAERKYRHIKQNVRFNYSKSLENVLVKQNAVSNKKKNGKT